MMRAITTSRCLAPRRRHRAPSTADLLIERICGWVVGDDVVLEVPFGPRTMVYADATASGCARTYAEARRIIRAAGELPPPGPLHDPTVSEDFERARWFPLPGEALAR